MAEKEKIVPIYGKMHTLVGNAVADAKEIATADGSDVEAKLNLLLEKIESLKAQVDDLIAGGGVTPTPPIKITDALMLKDGSYLKLKDGSYLKLKLKK